MKFCLESPQIVLFLGFKKISPINSCIMNLHEFQGGKQILSGYGVSVPFGIVADSPAKAIEAAKEIQKKTGSDRWAVKAQIHAGGRGKGGGVKIAKSLEEVEQFSDQILGMMLVTPQTSAEGKLVRRLLIEQNIYYPGPAKVEEYYVSILLNRTTGRNMICIRLAAEWTLKKWLRKHLS